MKRFSVRHQRSANKVGVDGVLIGAWAGVSATDRDLLDAGCGCGLIALMLAQRLEDIGATRVRIHAVDLDHEAVEEAAENIADSPWSDRIKPHCGDFRSELIQPDEMGGAEVMEGSDSEEGNRPGGMYDRIVSNPPFFHAGALNDGSARMLARHADTLSPEALLIEAPRMLRPGGRLAYIAQAESEERLREIGESEGLRLRRLTRVKGNPRAGVKRVMMEWERPECRIVPGSNRLTSRDRDPDILPEITELIIEHAPGDYTAQYIALCRDFYIKM